jgi:hypothetical protein
MNCVSEATLLVSKVLLLERDEESLRRVRQFCEQNNLVPLRSNKDNVDITTMLATNVDLGAIFVGHDYCGTFAETISLVESIRDMRPELPIAFRVDFMDSLSNIAVRSQRQVCLWYSLDCIDELRKLLDNFIFSLVYPTSLVRGISELSTNILASQFPGFVVTHESPYLVRDRIIYGEVFSLIPLESAWCRGYMMLQSGEEAILQAYQSAKGTSLATSIPYRAVNNLLGEITNLVWGAFKNRFIGDETVKPKSTTQIPIVTNHVQRYISFGSENPQLCFKYHLENDITGQALTIYQWFVFNLDWSPELFKETEASVDELVDAGELEFF